MNIFYVHPDPRVAARSLCDKHVIKMLLESAQILSTVRHGVGLPAPYRATHSRHPSTLWAGSSKAAYGWLWRHADALADEYLRRYGRVHKTTHVLEALREPPAVLPDVAFTPPPQAMPDEYRQPDAVDAYRTYYRNAKRAIATWRLPATQPEWMA